MTGGRPPAQRRLAELNDVLHRGVRYTHLTMRRGELLAEPRWRCSPWDAAATLVIESYAHIVAAGELSLIRVCDNPACSFVFFDDSRTRRRRWCDPAICGNLMHVRAHRSRQ